MNFEVLKRSHLKRNILVAVLIIVLLLGIVIIKNRTNTLSNSSINKESITKEINNNLIGAYIQEGEEYKQTDDIPSSGYEFNKEKSYCKIGDTIQEDITLFYDMDTQTITVSPITKEGLKCYLYFDEKAAAGDTILASENAPTSSTIDWTGGTTYYYTGDPNNWVQFAGFWWRIIRINGDGSIRMIYQGTSANTEGTGTQIQTSAFNSSYDHNRYVGYMYGSSNSDYNSTHTNTNPSTIKGILDTWYSKNLASNSDKIDGNAGFCGDRRVSSGTGGGTRETDYQPYTRIRNSSPSLSCEKADIYTIDEFEHGNGALTYPIGLISADEAMFAGIPNWNSSNSNNYLYTGQHYWTMSPYFFGDGGADVFYVNSSGYLRDCLANNTTPGVRPVINLKANVTILSGDGSSLNPYKITE